MKRTLSIILAAVFSMATASAQFSGNGSGYGPKDGTGYKGNGPKDGTGYGAKAGKGNGSGSPNCDGTGRPAGRGGQRGGRR